MKFKCECDHDAHSLLNESEPILTISNSLETNYCNKDTKSIVLVTFEGNTPSNELEKVHEYFCCDYCFEKHIPDFKHLTWVRRENYADFVEFDNRR